MDAGPKSRERQALKHRKRRVPAWWADAKLGIFIHWTPASVPGFAPTDHELGELLMAGGPEPQARLPYSEWYENSLRFPDSPVSRFHRATYGDRPYAGFADDFVAGLPHWDPAGWAKAFATTRARYVVLVTKHHDGWCLWPSTVSNPNRSGWFSERDLVGELAAAVRAEGMRFGVYYSGGLDWTFNDHPIGTISDGLLAVPRGAYPDYADAQVRELIDRYRPSVLWNDICWPTDQKRLDSLFSYYFAQVPDGVVNDRWLAQPPGAGLLRTAAVRKAVDRSAVRTIRKAGGMVPPKPAFYQYRTPEYATFDGVQLTPWELVRGMDKGFGYNHTSTEADFLTRDDLLRTLADTVAKGGNLLLNVGPRGADAQIPDEQLTRLGWLAEWTGANGDALQGTRTWLRDSDRTPEGAEVRYTATGDHVWALCWRDGGIDSVTLPFLATPTTAVSTAAGVRLEWKATDGGMRVEVGTAAGGIVAIAVDHADARPT